MWWVCDSCISRQSSSVSSRIFVAYREDSDVKQEIAEPVPSEADLARKRREEHMEQYRVSNLLYSTVQYLLVIPKNLAKYYE